VTAQNKHGQIKRDENLMIASKILGRNSSYPNLLQLETSEQNNINNNQPSDTHKEHKDHIFNPTSNITPYILLIALSIHGSIEGIALGVMNTLKECSILFTAILLHKWAEAFALGISFYKSGKEKNIFIKMILIFTLFGPLGIIIGMIFSDAGSLIKGIMLGISGGTFIYVAASEIIVEEFSLSKKIHIKYLWFICGGILTFLLTFIE
jgi:zinc transporter 1/2/3